MYVYVKQTQIYAYMYTRGFQSFNHLGLGLRIKEKKKFHQVLQLFSV